MQQRTSQFANKEGQKFRLNYDEFLISQVFHKDFKPSRLNNEGREVIDKHYWEERICCIHEDCHFPNDNVEKHHLKSTEFEPIKFQLVILEGMNPIWKYLIITKFRKHHKERLLGDIRLTNNKLDNKEIRKQGRGWTFVKKKNVYEVDPRIPINFRLRHWMITPQQINKK
jgi:hypothetical protein